MKARIPIAALALAAVTAAAASGAERPAATTAQKGGHPIRQMAVFSDGAVVTKRLRVNGTTVEVKGRPCAVSPNTPLAALIAARPGKLRLRDYGSCSSRPADAAGLFVRSIRGEVNRGLDGWVYKVGRKLGTAGAADPAGPFGRGRLRKGDRVVWLYCVFEAGSCQRSLELTWKLTARELSGTVIGYDDLGEGAAIAGARITARRVGSRGSRSARTGADGKASGVTLRPGEYLVRATKPGATPSFGTRVTVR
jgi:Carboxypeptidase regulatory-like domain